MNGAEGPSEILVTRLQQERKVRPLHTFYIYSSRLGEKTIHMWVRNLFLYLPSKGFTAKPIAKEDGTLDLTKWICEIPGPKEVKKTAYCIWTIYVVSMGWRCIQAYYGISTWLSYQATKM